MSSLRRSQKLSLKNLLIFLIILLRLKKSFNNVKVVKVNTARKVKANVATKIIINAIIKANTIKVNTVNVTVKANYLRNFKKHIINNFKAAKKTREAYVVKLQRRTNAAERVRV